ncbi:MAG: metal-dependent transcriptional regulator [Spirochaetales bacterium]|nr:metal-dependent transcriptional regulator [Spirochaetales bacterium]
MYLETILLLQKSHGHAHGVEVARELGVSKASVTKAMNRLQNEGFVEKEDYGAITLTAEGLKLSTSIYEKHRLLCAYLKHSLGVTQAVASENACRMEHIITDDLLDSISKYIREHQVEVLKWGEE